MAKKADKPAGELMVCRNSKGLMRYAIDERIEAGMVLMGSEVKSLRAKRGDLDGAYARVDAGELILHKMFIGPYEQATAFGHEPKRSRKLLAHKHEIERLAGKLATRGYTLIPTQVYFKGGRCKVELGLAKAKDIGDKRETIKRGLALREAKAAVSQARGRSK